jgi:CubicO group peptidase (beta-lactamase class C family)
VRGSRSEWYVRLVKKMRANSEGNILHKVESGTFALPERNPKYGKDDGARYKITADTVCWIASCTKMMTTVCVMQLVETGVLKLDDDVGTTWLPELKNPDIIVKMEDDKPVLTKAKRKVTLRNLLTHSSGLAYEFTHPKLAGWREWDMERKEGKAAARSADIAEAHRVPLLFEPDEGWIYGYGIDWAGLAVMRATKMTLEDYMSKNIWKPLGMTSTTFSMMEHRPDLIPRFAGMSLRDGDGDWIEMASDQFTMRVERVKYGGGGGCFSTANDYIKFLSSILNTMTADGSNQKLPQLLKRSTLEEMFKPGLTASATGVLRAMITHPLAFGLAGNIPHGVALSYGLGGLVTEERVPDSGRSAQSMQWSGLPNLFWWISPKDKICGCYFSQLLPTGDRLSTKLYSEFETAVLKEKMGRGKL